MELTACKPCLAERQKLWDTLTNIQDWKEAIPEAQRLTSTGENEYELEVKADVGPLKGNQVIKIRFTDMQAPTKLDFEIQHSMVKEVKGTFDLKLPGETLNGLEAPNPLPDHTITLLFYHLNADAGNPFINAILESLSAKVKDSFDELLGRLDNRAMQA